MSVLLEVDFQQKDGYIHLYIHIRFPIVSLSYALREGHRKNNRVLVLKDALFQTSKTVAILVELCAKMIRQDPKELLLDIYDLERLYPLSAT